MQLVIGLTEAWVAGELAQYLAPLSLLYYQYAVFYVLSGLFLVVAAIGRWHAGGRRSLRSQTLTGLLLGYLLLRLAYTHHPLAIAWIVMAFIAGRSRFGQQMQEVAQRWWRSPWSSRRDLGVCLVFFLLAWVTREVWAIRVVQSLGDNFPLASDDGVNYHVFALGVSRGEHPTWPYGGLIYWHLLGWLYRVAGPNFFVVTALQALLGATTASATYLIGRRLAGRGVGMLAATLVSLDANLIFLSIVLGMEAVFLPLMAWFLLAASSALASGRLWRPWWSLALGLVAGLAYMVRTELIGLPAVFAALACYAWSRHGVPGRMALRASLEFFAGIACGWMALGLANLVYSGEFAFQTRQASVIFAIGYGGTRTQELNAMGFNPFVDLGAAVQVLFLHPWTVIRTMGLSFAEKFVHFFLRPNFGTFDPVLLVLPYGTRMPMYSVLLQWYGGCLVCIGAWLVLRRRIHGIAGQWLGAYVVYTAVVYAVVAAGNARHRGVLLPILWIWLACAIQHAVMAVRRARVTSAVRMTTRGTSSIDFELTPASSP